MFDGAITQYSKRDPDLVEESWPWQLDALLLALVVVNFLAAVFCPGVVTSSGLEF